MGELHSSNGKVARTSSNLVDVLFVVLASFDHLVTATYAYFYEESAKWWLYTAQSNPFRMIEYSISASAMVWGITQLCGIHDVHLIMLICTGTALGMILGLCCELLPRDNEKDNIKISTIRNIIYWTAAASIFIPWLVVMCYFFQSANRAAPPDSSMRLFWQHFCYSSASVSILTSIALQNGMISRQRK